MGTLTSKYALNLPTVGGDTNTWGALTNDNWSKLDTLLSTSLTMNGVRTIPFATLADLQADTTYSLAGGGGTIILTGGEIIEIHDIGARLQVLATGMGNAGYTNSATVPLQMNVLKSGGAWFPKHFGAPCDGVNDDAPAWNNLIAAMSSGDMVIANDQYLLSASIPISNLDNWQIIGTGTFKVANGSGVTLSNSVFDISNCNGWRIWGFVCDGNRANRTPSESTGHLIRIGSCNNWIAEAVEASNGTTDGFIVFANSPVSISNTPTNWQMINCRGDNNYRNNVSVINSINWQIIGGSLTNANGVSPQAGIDVESDVGNPNASIQDGIIFGVNFDGNLGYNLQVSGTSNPRNIVAQSCTFKNGALGQISWSSGGAIRDCLFDGGTDSMTRGVIDIPSSSRTEHASLTIVQPTFRNMTMTTASNPCLYVHGASLIDVTLDDPDIDTAFNVAAFNSTNAILRNVSRIAATTGDIAFAFNGDNAYVENISASGFYGRFIYFGSTNPRLRGVRLSDPSYNNPGGGGAIQIDTSATGAVIDDVIMSLSVGAAQFGLYIGASPRSIRDCHFPGYTSASNAVFFVGLTGSDTSMIRSNITANGVPIIGMTIPTCTFAQLPATGLRRVGDELFVTNGRKSGEGAGAGTGVEAQWDGTQWFCAATGAAVTA